jgi:hypothetical protein
MRDSLYCSNALKRVVEGEVQRFDAVSCPSAVGLVEVEAATGGAAVGFVGVATRGAAGVGGVDVAMSGAAVGLVAVDVATSGAVVGLGGVEVATSDGALGLGEVEVASSDAASELVDVGVAGHVAVVGWDGIGAAWCIAGGTTGRSALGSVSIKRATPKKVATVMIAAPPREKRCKAVPFNCIANSQMNSEILARKCPINLTAHQSRSVRSLRCFETAQRRRRFPSALRTGLATITTCEEN